MRCETAVARAERREQRLPIVWWLGHPPCVSPRILSWEGFRLAGAKFEVAGEKCDLRLQLRQKRQESREKQEAAPHKLENPPWDILVGSLWWVFGAFLSPGEILIIFWPQAASREQRAERRKRRLSRKPFLQFFCWPEGGGRHGHASPGPDRFAAQGRWILTRGQEAARGPRDPQSTPQKNVPRRRSPKKGPKPNP